MPTPTDETATTLPGLALLLIQLAVETGVPSGRWQALIAMHDEDMQTWQLPDARVPLKLVYALWELLAEHLPDQPFSLQSANIAPPDVFGAAMHAALRAQSIGDGMEVFARFQHVLRADDRMVLRRTTRAGLWAMHIDYDQRVSPAIPRIVEAAAAHTVVLAQRLAQRPLPPPRWVSFTHAPAGPVHVYTDFFAAPVHFDAAESLVAYDAAVMAGPTRSPDPHLHHYLVEHLEAVLAGLDAATDPLAEVRGVLLGCSQDGDYRAATVARALGVSVRTLQRRIGAQGTTFRRLVDEARLVAARDLLDDERMSIDEVAFLLGYSELRAFNRAFVRWTGVTPAQHRRRMR